MPDASRLQDVEGAHCHAVRLQSVLGDDFRYRPPHSTCGVAAWPAPFSSPSHLGDPRAEGLAIAAWVCVYNDVTNETKHGKASLAGFIVNLSLIHI